MAATAWWAGCGRLGYGVVTRPAEPDGSVADAAEAIPDAAVSRDARGDAEVPRDARGDVRPARLDAGVDRIRADGATAVARWVASGTYVGDGVADHAIDDLPFAPAVVFVRSAAASDATFVRTGTMAANQSRSVSDFNALPASDGVRAFTANGFTVGTSARVNAAGTTYHYFALRTVQGRSAIGTFAQTSAARAITGVGFRPDHVVVTCDGRAPVHRTRDMPISMQLASGSDTGSAITSFDADGFSLGTDATVAGNGTSCHWLALREDPERVAIGSYVGDRVARTITAPGFRPEVVWLQCHSTTSFPGLWRPASLGDVDATFRFSFAAPFPNAITTLLDDGFSIGTDNQANSDPCYWVALSP